jgi:hypothetical protein
MWFWDRDLFGGTIYSACSGGRAVEGGDVE